MIINTTHGYQSKIGSFEVIIERAIPTWSLVFSCTSGWLPFFTMSSHWLMTMLSFVLIDSLITFNWFPMFSHLINRLTPKSN